MSEDIIKEFDWMQKLCDEATVKPWRYSKNTTGVSYIMAAGTGQIGKFYAKTDTRPDRPIEGEANAALAAASRTDMPQLLEYARWATQELRELEYHSEECLSDEDECICGGAEIRIQAAWNIAGRGD